MDPLTENKRLTLVEKKKKEPWGKWLLLLAAAAILILGIYYMIISFSIESMEISGLATYSDEEVIHAVQTDLYLPNTLVMIAENRLLGHTYLPFIEKVTMTYKDPHILRIRVKEGLRAGVFEYMKKYVYFDSEGIAMESRNHLFEGVPVVTGVEYDKLVLGQKIPVRGDYFSTIVLITKSISTYKLKISEIHFDGENEITLVSGPFRIYLGDSSYLEDKMAKVSSVLSAVEKSQKGGTIDLHLYTDEKEIITFHE